jgi:hypothetical protein
MLIALTLGVGAALAAFSQVAPPAATPPPAPPVQQRPPAPPPYNCEPVNPNATPEARALLKTLCAVSGKGILSGQHNFPNQRSQDTDRVYAATGKYPAIWGSDFGFLDGEDKDSIVHRDLMIEEAKKQAAAGSIIYLCWHMLRPTEDEPGKADPNGRMSESWRGSVQARLADEQWLELITPDTPLHMRWEKYMDTAAGFLKQLQDAHIPVLWRPMHENNGTPPPAETLKSQPKWVWFMDWAGGVDRQADRLKTAYSDAWALGRGDPLPN